MPHTKEQRKEYRIKNSQRLDLYEFARGLRRNYSMTVEHYNRLFSEQQSCCAICKRHQGEFKRRLAVDHCHASKEIRGLLCYDCNPMLGYAKDNEDRLLAAVSYLRKFKK